MTRKKKFVEEINQNELMSKKYKSATTALDYDEYFFILASVHTRFVSISALVGIDIGITSSETCATTAAIKKYKPLIKKKKKRHDKMVLLGKTKLNNIKVLISQTLTDS